LDIHDGCLLVFMRFADDERARVEASFIPLFAGWLGEYFLMIVINGSNCSRISGGG